MTDDHIDDLTQGNMTPKETHLYRLGYLRALQQCRRELRAMAAMLNAELAGLGG